MIAFIKRLFGRDKEISAPMVKPVSGHPGNGYVVISIHNRDGDPRICISASLIDAARGKICPGDRLDLEVDFEKSSARVYHHDLGNAASRTSSDPKVSKNLRVKWQDTFNLADIIIMKTRLPIIGYPKDGGLLVQWPFVHDVLPS